MKKIIVALVLCVIACSAKAESDTIQVSFNKTIHIFFDSNVKYFDVGSPDVLIDSATAMVKLKAAIVNFKPTNLTVLTEKGYHHFILTYKENPAQYVYKITTANPIKETASETKSQESNNVIDFESACKQVLAKGATINDIGIVGRKTNFLMKGIFIDSDYLFFVVEIENRSNINYDIDFLKFLTRNNKLLNTKKYAIQETVLEPVFILNDSINTVDANSSVLKVFVFKKFTIASDKKMFVELWEKGGERQLNFTLDDADILEAKKIY